MNRRGIDGNITTRNGDRSMARRLAPRRRPLAARLRQRGNDGELGLDAPLKLATRFPLIVSEGVGDWE